MLIIEPSAVSPIVKYYLVTYNVLSTIGWSYVLITTLVHIFNLTGSSIDSAVPRTASSTLTKLFSSLPYLKSSGFAFATHLESHIPPFLQPLYRRTFTTYSKVGIQTAFVQSFALLEIFHVLFGWVRSPLQTTAMQVASRLFLVWGIAEQFEVVSRNTQNLLILGLTTYLRPARIPYTHRWSLHGLPPKSSATLSTRVICSDTNPTSSYTSDIPHSTCFILWVRALRHSLSTLLCPIPLLYQDGTPGSKAYGSPLIISVPLFLESGGLVSPSYLSYSTSPKRICEQACT